MWLFTTTTISDIWSIYQHPDLPLLQLFEPSLKISVLIVWGLQNWEVSKPKIRSIKKRLMWHPNFIWMNTFLSFEQHHCRRPEFFWKQYIHNLSNVSYVKKMVGFALCLSYYYYSNCIQLFLWTISYFTNSRILKYVSLSTLWLLCVNSINFLT